LYTIRINGRLEASALSAFPPMISELKGSSGGARARSLRGSPAIIHPYRVMRDHLPVDDPDPMVAQLPRSWLIILGA
jgi:hypothetical protein